MRFGKTARRPFGQAVAGPLLTALALPASFLTGCDRGVGAAAQPSDSAGVRLVSSPAPDRPLSATAVKVVNLHTPDSALTAVPWGIAADPSTARIYALDWTGERVAVFDRDGDFLEWIGGRGDGPGEFRDPAALVVDPYGALQVLDAGRGIVSRWSGTGSLLNEQQAPKAYWGPGFAATEDGWLYVASVQLEMEQREVLVRSVGDDTTGLYALPRRLVMMELPCVRQPAARVFAPSVVWTARGDTTWVREGTGYRVDVLVGSALVASYRRPVEPVRVTRAMAEARVELGPYAALMRACRVSASEVVDAVGHEETASPVLWLTRDTGGRLWVTRTADGIRPSHVDVLGPEGRYQGTIDLEAIPVTFLSDSAFVALALDALTQVTLSLYELRGAATVR